MNNLIKNDNDTIVTKWFGGYKTNSIMSLDCKINKIHNIVDFGDTVWFCVFRFSKNCNLRAIKSFKIYVGDKILLDIPFKLLLKLSNKLMPENLKQIVIEEHIFVYIPKEIFFGSNACSSIYLRSLRYPLSVCLLGLESFTSELVSCRKPIEYSLILEYGEKMSYTCVNDVQCPINNYKEFVINGKNICINFPARYVGLFINTNKIDSMRIVFKRKSVNCETIEYDHEMLKYVGQIIYDTHWTQDHYKIMNESLTFFPRNALNIISSYISNDVNFTKYFYWLPFDHFKSWMEEANAMPLVDSVEILFDKVYKGKIYVMFRNYYVNRNSIGFPLYVFE